MLEDVLSGVSVMTDPYSAALRCAPGLQNQSGLEVLFPPHFTKFCGLTLSNIFIFHRFIIWTGDSATATVIFSL